MEESNLVQRREGANEDPDKTPCISVTIKADRGVLTWLNPLAGMGVRGGFGVRFTLLVLGAVASSLGHWWLRA